MSQKQRITYDSELDALVAVAKQLSRYEDRYRISSEDFFRRFSNGQMERYGGIRRMVQRLPALSLASGDYRKTGLPPKRFAPSCAHAQGTATQARILRS